MDHVGRGAVGEGESGIWDQFPSTVLGTVLRRHFMDYLLYDGSGEGRGRDPVVRVLVRVMLCPVIVPSSGRAKKKSPFGSFALPATLGSTGVRVSVLPNSAGNGRI